MAIENLLAGALLFHAYLSSEDKRAKEAKENAESARKRKVDAKRMNTPCRFDEGVTSREFYLFAKEASKTFKRIKSFEINGGVIYCSVISQSGNTVWKFNVDFNNWGHITRTFWIESDNKDSIIPKRFGTLISDWIGENNRKKHIQVRNWTNYVEENYDLESSDGAGLYYNQKVTRNFLGMRKSQYITINYGIDDLVGEHLYPVISLLKTTGFKNIKTFAIEDVNDSSSEYIFQVSQISIGNSCNSFTSGTSFSEFEQVCITYHVKQKIIMPYKASELKHKNYQEVLLKLKGEGFTKVYVEQREDVLMEWLYHDGDVENVLIDDTNIIKGDKYYYDQKIVVCYHTKKEIIPKEYVDAWNHIKESVKNAYENRSSVL